MQVNSYALQVEPARFRMLDKVKIGCGEARHIEKTCNLFLNALGNLVKKLAMEVRRS
jgi:hypothetical protein